MHILQDGRWDYGYEPYIDEIIFIEDNPASDSVNILDKPYKLISYDNYIKTHLAGYGHVSAFNIGYKKKIAGEVKNLLWLNSFSNNFNRFYGTNIGKGVRINAYSYVDSNVTIGDFVKLNSFAFIGHDSSVGDYSYISQHVVLDNHVSVGSECYIFENSTLLPGVHIGDNTIVGAGSVVTKDIPTGVIAYGNPCKVVRFND